MALMQSSQSRALSMQNKVRHFKGAEYKGEEARRKGSANVSKPELDAWQKVHADRTLYRDRIHKVQCTELKIIVGTSLGNIYTTVLLGSVWVLLNKTNKSLFRALLALTVIVCLKHQKSFPFLRCCPDSDNLY